jgi:hypothetical protein
VAAEFRPIIDFLRHTASGGTYRVLGLKANYRPESGAELVNLGKWFLLAAVIAGGVHLWHVHQRSVIDRELLASADSDGFVSVVMPDGAPPDTVLIFAALNCPSAQAKRANAMATQLSQMGIPTIRTSNYSVANVTRDQMPMLTRTNAVMGGEIPIVLINGVAKANPTVDEVASEYRRNK